MGKRSSIAGRLTGFRDLLAFATGIPLGGGDLEAAARAFPLAPLVGILEGLLAGLALAATAALGATPLLAGAVYTTVHLIVTGGIHMDGFSDYADVIGSRLRGERAVAVLKDPRRGGHALAWTAAALTLSTAAAGELAAHQHWLRIPALTALVYAASAEAMYATLALGGREPYQGLGGLFKDHMDRAGHALNLVAYAATALALAVASQTGWLASGILLVAPLPLAVAVARDAGSRLGFVNGDVAGFAFETTRTVLLVAAAILEVGGLLGPL